LFQGLFGLAGFLLQFFQQLFPIQVRYGKILLRELGVFLFDFAFELIPFAF